MGNNYQQSSILTDRSSPRRADTKISFKGLGFRKQDFCDDYWTEWILIFTPSNDSKLKIADEFSKSG